MSFDRQASAAVIVACLTLLVCGIGFRVGVVKAQAYLAKAPVPLRDVLENVPRTLGAWRASTTDPRLTEEEVEVLGTRHYLDRVYVREAAGAAPASINLHVAYYTGMIDAVPHVPDRCLTAHGWVTMGLPENVDLPIDRGAWRPDPLGQPYPLLTFFHHVTGSPVTVRMPKGDFKLRTTEFRLASSPEQRIFAGYFFIANGHTTPMPEGVRVLAFDLSSRYAYYAKVQFTMAAPSECGKAEFAALAAEFAGELLPELMRCLPDWVEVESGGVNSGGVG